MTCNGCGNQQARVWRRYEGGQEACDACGGLGSVYVPDVFFKSPYLDENLGNPKRDAKEKNGVWVESRRHKAQLMAEQGLREAGDRVRGARNEL